MSATRRLSVCRHALQGRLFDWCTLYRCREWHWLSPVERRIDGRCRRPVAWNWSFCNMWWRIVGESLDIPVTPGLKSVTWILCYMSE